MNPDASSMLKFAVDLEPIIKEGWPPSSTEWLWGERIADDRARVCNVPFYAKGISFGDIVSIEQVSDGEASWHEFAGVVAQGGHSTYRLFVPEGIGHAAFERHWALLKAIGCSYESFGEKFLAVDVPPEADVQTAYIAFEDGERAAVWEFEEGNYESKATV